MKKYSIILSALIYSISFSVEADVSRECRGVAAGIVSAMKANEEIANEDMMLVAVKAARRACAAALEGFSEDDIAELEESDSKSKEKKMSTWEFLTQEQEKKAGNKRLDRLKN